MTATTIVRGDIAQDILLGVGALPACSGARFEFGFPGDETKSELVWLASIDGDIEMPLMTPSRKPRSDRFRMLFRVQITSKREIRLAFDRLVEIVGAFDDYLANHSTIATRWTGVVMSLSLTTPTMAVTTLPEGPVAIGEVLIEVHTRLT